MYRTYYRSSDIDILTRSIDMQGLNNVENDPSTGMSTIGPGIAIN